jgi:hypothetical protein
VPRLSSVQQAKLFIAERSNVWGLLRTRRSQIGWVQDLLDGVQVETNRRPTSPWHATVRLVEQIQSESWALGAQFLAADAARADERRDIMEALGRRMHRASVSYVDVWGAMKAVRATAPPEHWDFMGPDRHWNVGAHRAMAEIVAREIVQRDLLAESGRHRTRSARVANADDRSHPRDQPSSAPRTLRAHRAEAPREARGIARRGVGFTGDARRAGPRRPSLQR